MAWLFGITLFLGAALLFLVQPMVGRMVLPLLGGVPSVWITCQVFFQAVLLVGYGYAHGLTQRLSWRQQALAHGGFYLVGLALLPIGIGEADAAPLLAGGVPILWLLGVLSVAVGLPFLILSANTPLLLRWFSRTGHGSAGDPHFLYAASNLGSLIAIAGYPFGIEPVLGLRSQSMLWAGLYLLYGLLLSICWIVGHRSGGGLVRSAMVEAHSSVSGETVRVSTRRMTSWVLLALAPSSLMLGVTLHLTTDLASIPLLWLAPLGVYLLTFVIAFSPAGGSLRVGSRKVVRLLVPLVAFLILSRAAQPIAVIGGLHLVFLFGAALACHGRLAEDRPAAGELTRFYFCIALGGVLGGLFNAVVAPLLFHSVVEYPLAVLMVCLLAYSPLVPTSLATSAAEVWRARRAVALDLALPMLVGAFAAVTMLGAVLMNVSSTAWRNALGLGLPLVAAFACVDRPRRFALAVAAVLLVGWNFSCSYGPSLRVERDFFGVVRVVTGIDGRYHMLVHGNTLHGRQFADSDRRCEPLSYYHRTGPLAEIFDVARRFEPPGRTAVVGLGAGSMVSYARPGEEWTFYEIAPAVVRAAQDTNCFTFLDECAAAPVSIVEGDARLRLREAPGRHYDLLAIDAFSSDAIPVHLLTVEAMRLYLSKLTDRGLLAFHISNRYVDLEPVLAGLARDAGLVARGFDDWQVTAAEEAEGKEASQWVVMARRASDLGALGRRANWLPLAGGGTRPWTDDYSHLLGALRW